MDPPFIVVHILEARDVGRRVGDSLEIVSAKCSVALVDRQGKRKETKWTHIGRKTGNPTWDSKVVLAVDLDVMGVEVAVVDAETDDLLGHVALPLSLVMQQQATLDDWLSLGAPRKSVPHNNSSTNLTAPVNAAPDNKLGQLHIRMSVVDLDEKLSIETEEKLKEDIRRREREIFKLFSLEDEPFVREFSCAFEKTILHQGRLYITPHYVLFHAPFAKKIIGLDSIKSIDKRKTAGVFNTALAIVTKDDKECVFKSFRKRDILDDLGEISTAGGEEPTESSESVIPKQSRSSSSLVVPSRSLSSRSRHASAPSHKKRRRKSAEDDEPSNDPGDPLTSAKEVDPVNLVDIVAANESSEENDIVVEKKEQEASARLKQKLLIGDLVSGEEEESSEDGRRDGSSSSAYRSAHDGSVASSGVASPDKTRIRLATEDTQPLPSKGSVPAADSPTSSRKRKPLEKSPLPSMPAVKSSQPSVATGAQPSLSTELRRVAWPSSTQEGLATGLRLCTSIFVVVFVSSLVFPGIQWGSASTWLLSSLYLSVCAAAIRLFIAKYSCELANKFVLAVGGKVSPKTAVLGDYLLPGLFMVIVNAALLYSASWVFADFMITGPRSWALHSCCSTLSSMFLFSF